MRTVSVQPAALADRIPLPEREAVDRRLSHARRGFGRKVVVLDDDPTGTQTVHDAAVYTGWEEETLRRALLEEEKLFFVLTNSRSFTEEETARAHREIAKNLLEASRRTGVPFLLVSRGDSTLRGHYPLETQTLRETLERESRIRYDGEIIMPCFLEGGRVTIDNVHYVKSGAQLIPVGMTEFARDAAFSYAASDLTEWCEERSGGAFHAGEITTVSLEELRSLDYEGVLKKLKQVREFGKIVVNAADSLDVKVFVTALFLAVEAGKEFLIRSAAGVVAALGDVSERPLLSGGELCRGDRGRGGMVLVGSHVEKTTRQLQRLLSSDENLTPVCFDVSTVLNGNQWEKERARAAREAEKAISSGRTAVVYTSRRPLRTEGLEAGARLELSARISRAFTSVLEELTVPPRFLIAKGGITSSDVGTRVLGVKRAWVMGQILPGVPVWQTDEDSRFPGLPYVIFPGNVGDETSLYEAVFKLSHG